MGKQEDQPPIERKPRFLCLHGFRTIGEILKKKIGKWPQSILEKLDLVFLNAPFPSTGKSDVEGFFDPPYYEWYQLDKEFTEFKKFDKSLAYIEDFMIKHGPFDGLLGFSQGAILSAALPGLQAAVLFCASDQISQLISTSSSSFFLFFLLLVFLSFSVE